MTLFDAASWPEYGATVTVWRSPAASGGTVAALAVAGTVVGVMVPAQQFSAGGMGAAPDGLGGVRYDLAFVAAGTVVRVGDELRRGTAKYKAQKVDQWGPEQITFVDLAF